MKLELKVKPTDKERQWELLETIWYKGIKVPSGFIFDGASIPIGLRWLFPHGGKKFFAACIHDYAYRTGCTSRDTADDLFLDAMLENDVNPWKANSMYSGVRMFGMFTWSKHRRSE